MKLYVLFGLRFQDYDGQYAPEALSVIDEFAHEETDVWIHEQYHKQHATGDFESLRIVEIDFDRDDLDAIFRPPPPIQGDVSDPVSDLVMTCKTIIANISNRQEVDNYISPEESSIRCRLAGALKKIQDLTS